MKFLYKVRRSWEYSLLLATFFVLFTTVGCAETTPEPTKGDSKSNTNGDSKSNTNGTGGTDDVKPTPKVNNDTLKDAKVASSKVATTSTIPKVGDTVFIKLKEGSGTLKFVLTDAMVNTAIAYSKDKSKIAKVKVAGKEMPWTEAVSMHDSAVVNSIIMKKKTAEILKEMKLILGDIDAAALAKAGRSNLELLASKNIFKYMNSNGVATTNTFANFPSTTATPNPLQDNNDLHYFGGNTGSVMASLARLNGVAKEAME